MLKSHLAVQSGIKINDRSDFSSISASRKTNKCTARNSQKSPRCSICHKKLEIELTFREFLPAARPTSAESEASSLVPEEISREMLRGEAAKRHRRAPANLSTHEKEKKNVTVEARDVSDVSASENGETRQMKALEEADEMMMMFAPPKRPANVYTYICIYLYTYAYICIHIYTIYMYINMCQGSFAEKSPISSQK